LTKGWSLPNGCELSGRGARRRFLFLEPASRSSVAYGAESPVRSSEGLCGVRLSHPCQAITTWSSAVGLSETILNSMKGVDEPILFLPT